MGQRYSHLSSDERILNQNQRDRNLAAFDSDTVRTILAGFLRMRFSSRAVSSAFFRTDQVSVAVFGL